MEVVEAMRKRRRIGAYKSTPVDQKTLDMIVRESVSESTPYLGMKVWQGRPSSIASTWRQ